MSNQAPKALDLQLGPFAFYELIAWGCAWVAEQHKTRQQVTPPGTPTPPDEAPAAFPASPSSQK